MNEQRYRRTERALWDSVGVRPAERFVRLDRTGATVRVQEVGTGETVVFVHGASNGAASWASLVCRIDGFRCVLIDRPGCGLSPRPRVGATDMTALGEFADALVVDVIDATEADAAHVVGTSFGGYFVLRAAAAHPLRVRRVVTLSWSFGAPVASTPWMMRLAMQPVLRRLATRIPPTERMVRAMLKQIGLRHAVESGRFGQVELDWFRAILRDTDTMRNEIDAMPPVIGLRGFDERTLLPAALLARISQPALFLWGLDDPMGGEDVARAFVQHLPNAHLELMPGAGHAPWMDDPDQVAGLISTFLRAQA